MHRKNPLLNLPGKFRGIVKQRLDVNLRDFPIPINKATTMLYFRLKNKEDSSSESDILISGASARNRAVHGDIVTVEILPKNQWLGRSNALRSKTESDGKFKSFVLENSVRSSCKALSNVMKQIMVLYVDTGTDDSDNSRNTMPTGRIVGIVQRNWKDYVASFAKDEVPFKT